MSDFVSSCDDVFNMLDFVQLLKFASYLAEAAHELPSQRRNLPCCHGERWQRRGGVRLLSPH